MQLHHEVQREQSYTPQLWGNSMHTWGTEGHALWQQGAAMPSCHHLCVVSLFVDRP